MPLLKAEAAGASHDHTIAMGDLLRLGLLELPPAACAVVGDDLFEHRRQGARLDLFSLAVGDRSGGLVGVAGGDDAVGVGDDAAVVEEQVDVVLGGEEGADVAGRARSRAGRCA
jgi:hypothetical protein